MSAVARGPTALIFVIKDVCSTIVSSRSSPKLIVCWDNDAKRGGGEWGEIHTFKFEEVRSEDIYHRRGNEWPVRYTRQSNSSGRWGDDGIIKGKGVWGNRLENLIWWGERDCQQGKGEWQVWYYTTIKFEEERMDIFAEEVNKEIYTLQSNLTRRGHVLMMINVNDE